MTIGDKYYIQKKNFVAELSKVLNMAKPHLTCEFKLGEELDPNQPGGEYVIVTCENGYQYKLNVSADSLAAIGEEVFTKMVCK